MLTPQQAKLKKELEKLLQNPAAAGLAKQIEANEKLEAIGSLLEQREIGSTEERRLIKSHIDEMGALIQNSFTEFSKKEFKPPEVVVNVPEIKLPVFNVPKQEIEVIIPEILVPEPKVKVNVQAPEVTVNVDLDRTNKLLEDISNIEQPKPQEAIGLLTKDGKERWDYTDIKEALKSITRVVGGGGPSSVGVLGADGTRIGNTGDALKVTGTLTTTEATANNTYGTATSITTGATATIVNITSSTANFKLRGFNVTGTTDGKFFIDINSSIKYIGRTNGAVKSLLLQLPNPDIVTTGSQVRLRVINEGDVTGDFEGTLLAE